MMQQSESIAALAAALAKAQGVVEGALKDRNNPAFKSKYADLSSVWEACREPLSSNGLSVVQFPGEMVDNRMTMTTQLSHMSGEWMRATLSIPLTKVDAQGYGSAVTYARRYALAAVVGVCPEDDDGNAAAQSTPRQEQRQAEPRHDPVQPLVKRAPVISDAQRDQLMTLATAAGVTAPDLLRKCGGLTDLRELPAEKFDPVFDWLGTKAAQRKPVNPQSSDILSDEVPF